MIRIFSFIILSILAFESFGQRLESAQLLRTFSTADISQLANGFPVLFEVDVYKVRYFTPDEAGVDKIASGMLAIPQDASLAFPLACLQHGTVAGREDVPSRLLGGYSTGVILAGLGYVSVMPDYVGLGDSPGIHLYVHAETEASAGRDLLRAARELEDDENFPVFHLNDQVFVSGYSQGGHAAMALHRMLETNFSNEFNVTASAPMSGPYSISEKMKEFTLGDDDYGTVAYIAWVILSYQRAYPSTVGQITLEEIFKPEYLDNIIAFKNENINLWTLNSRLTTSLLNNVGSVTPKDLLLPDVLNSYLTDPTHPLSVASAENDTYDWTPQAPTNLYHCVGDEQVVFENAILAENVMTANGSTSVKSIRIDSDNNLLDHGGCVPGASTSTILFFNSFQEITPVSNTVVDDPLVQVYYHNNILNVNIPNERKENLNRLMVYSMNGVLLLNRDLDERKTQEDVSELSQGMYWVLLSDSHGVFKSQKIIKL